MPSGIPCAPSAASFSYVFFFFHSMTRRCLKYLTCDRNTIPYQPTIPPRKRHTMAPFTLLRAMPTFFLPHPFSPSSSSTSPTSFPPFPTPKAPTSKKPKGIQTHPASRTLPSHTPFQFPTRFLRLISFRDAIDDVRAVQACEECVPGFVASVSGAAVWGDVCAVGGWLRGGGGWGGGEEAHGQDGWSG